MLFVLSTLRPPLTPDSLCPSPTSPLGKPIDLRVASSRSFKSPSQSPSPLFLSALETRVNRQHTHTHTHKGRYVVVDTTRESGHNITSVASSGTASEAR